MRDEQILDLYFAHDEQAIAETEKCFGAECKRLSVSILHGEKEEKVRYNEKSRKL